MAAAIAACLCTGSVTVTGAEAVEKSYPHFWEDYDKMKKE
jgi:3-phosphoshikimate 1-carboxyvinyltransferase